MDYTVFHANLGTSGPVAPSTKPCYPPPSCPSSTTLYQNSSVPIPPEEALLSAHEKEEAMETLVRETIDRAKTLLASDDDPSSLGTSPSALSPSAMPSIGEASLENDMDFAQSLLLHRQMHRARDYSQFQNATQRMPSATIAQQPRLGIDTTGIPLKSHNLDAMSLPPFSSSSQIHPTAYGTTIPKQLHSSLPPQGIHFSNNDTPWKNILEQAQARARAHQQAQTGAMQELRKMMMMESDPSRRMEMERCYAASHIDGAFPSTLEAHPNGYMPLAKANCHARPSNWVDPSSMTQSATSNTIGTAALPIHTVSPETIHTAPVSQIHTGSLPPQQLPDSQKPLPNKSGGGLLDRYWSEMYAKLVAFVREHGHACVPFNYSKDPRLGTWVKNQRTACKRPDRIRKLHAVGFVFSASRAKMILDQHKARRDREELLRRAESKSSAAALRAHSDALRDRDELYRRVATKSSAAVVRASNDLRLPAVEDSGPSGDGGSLPQVSHRTQPKRKRQCVWSDSQAEMVQERNKETIVRDEPAANEDQGVASDSDSTQSRESQRTQPKLRRLLPSIARKKRLGVTKPPEPATVET